MPNIEAGRLRHRIDIDDKVTVQDATGDPVVSWVPWATSVPAAIEPASGREFMGLHQLLGQSRVVVVIRWMPSVTKVMRIRHNDGVTTTVYNIVDVVPDQESGRDHLMLPVVAGTNEG